jgi:hypothetical protein
VEVLYRALAGVRETGVLNQIEELEARILRCSYLELDEYDYEDRPRPDNG